MQEVQHQTIESLPEMLTAQHIANHLGISRRRVYELFQISSEAGGIPNIDIGFSKRVEKKDLITWIDSRKKLKAEKVNA